MVNMRVRVGILTNQTRETSFQQYARSRFLWNTLRASSSTVCLSIPLSGIWPYFRSTRPNRFALPPYERTCRQQNAVTHFDRHFTPFSRFEIINYFGGNGSGEYFSSKRKFSSSVHLSPNHTRLENWNKVMILFQAAEVNGLTDD